MGSVGADDGDSRNELEEGLRIEIKAIGRKLLGLDFSTYEELLNLLERAKIILFEVNQKPSESTKGALLALTMALYYDEFMQCEDFNIQIAVASCWNELMRINAPEPLSEDNHKMEAIFKLLLVAIEQLSDESTSNYETQLTILETTAKVKSHYTMMDVDSSGLVVEMFLIFLNTIRSDHPHDIYKYMRDIMTMVIEAYDEDEISTELLKPLLASVRRDNKNVSPMAWELGKTIIEKCAAKLKPHLQEAVRSMNLVIDDYAEIVISLCRDTSTGETMNDRKASEALQSDEGVPNNEPLPGTLGSCEQIVQLDSDEVRPPNMEHGSATVNPDTNKRSFQRKKGRKSNLRNELAGPSGTSRKELVNGAYSNKGAHSKKKKESLDDQVDDLESSTAVRRQISQMEAGESSCRRKPTKAKSKKNLSQEKKPETTAAVEYGDELVNRRVMVLWPEDKTFYTGTITAFDPVEKKHTVTYDDDDVEVLNLTEEKWEPFVDRTPQEFARSSNKEEEADDHPPPAEEPVKRPENTEKRKPCSSKDKHGASSSKRLKRESHNVLNSQGDSAKNAVADTQEDAKDEGENRSGTEERLEKTAAKGKAGPSIDKNAATSCKRLKCESHDILNSQSDSDSAQNAVLVADTPEDSRISQRNVEENRSGPENQTEPNRRISSRSTKGYHYKQRFGRFFS